MSGYRPRSRVTPERPTAPERAAASFVRGAVRVPGVRRFFLLPAIARIGYWIATGLAYAWGWVMFGRHSVREGLHVFSELPRWTFGRGGTTIGATYLTHDGLLPRVLEHEAVHREQWKHYGLAFPVLYLAAGKVASTNRFEVDADLKKGGYV
jgi:hypothetical protein